MCFSLAAAGKRSSRPSCAFKEFFAIGSQTGIRIDHGTRNLAHRKTVGQHIGCSKYCDRLERYMSKDDNDSFDLSHLGDHVAPGAVHSVPQSLSYVLQTVHEMEASRV